MTLDGFIIIVSIVVLLIAGILLWLNNNTFIFSKVEDRSKRYVNATEQNKRIRK